MRSFLRNLLWRVHHYDVALSHRITRGAPAGRLLALLGAHLGDSLLWAALFAWLWRAAAGVAPVERAGRRRLLAAWLATVLAANGLTLAVKRFVRRARPGSGLLLYGAGPDVHSFPSGHATRMAAIGVWGLPVFGRRGWLVWPMAAAIGWSRVRLGIHYVGDIAAGAALGAGVGWVGRRLYVQARRREAAQRRGSHAAVGRGRESQG